MTSAKAVSFLAKKSWHTATMRHMEKVWLAEQRAASEEKKMAELRQELAEEREMEALRKAHESATGIKKTERVDFLYSEPLLNEPSADDYLLGAKYKDNGSENDVKNVQTKPGSLWLDQPALNSDSIQDKRTKIREDPLFLIKKEEQNQKASLKNNPIKMEKLRKEILMRKLLEELKKEKKERKRKRLSDTTGAKSREERHKEDKESHPRPDTEREISRDINPNFERNPKDSSNERDRENGDRRRERSSRDNSRERARGDRRRSSRDDSTERERGDHKRERTSRDHSRERDRSRDRDRNRVRNVRDTSRERELSRERKNSPPRHKRRNSPSNRERSSRERELSRERKNSPPRHKRRESPPDRERDRAPKVFRKKEFSEEERLQKLQEMQLNAVQLEQERIAKISKYNKEYTEEAKDLLSKDNTKVTPQFINTIGKEVFTSASTASVEDRIKRAKFYIQKDNLDERGIFK